MNATPDAGPSLPPEGWASGEPGEVSALDRRVLAGLRRLDPQQDRQLISRVLATFRESMHRLLQQADSGLGRGDRAAIQLAVHTLKSASASVGAKPMASLCATIEAAAPAGDAASLGSMLEQLSGEVARVDRAVAQLLAKLAAQA